MCLYPETEVIFSVSENMIHQACQAEHCSGKK